MKSIFRSSIFILLGSLFATALGQSSANVWDFSYPQNKGAGSQLDLRYLNEKQAGETGYVRVSPDGSGFVRGDGKPIRFWPVCGYGYRLKPEEMAVQARFFAKMGINMVRIHASLSPKGKGKDITDFDADEIDHIQRYVAALKKEGIYTTISPFWANGGAAGASASWGLGYGDGEDVWGLLFFNERIQNAYKGWIKKLYLSSNPYTGIPLAVDPAVAIVQVQNEDGLLFWTFQGIKPTQKKLLAAKFGKWLAHKYGSISAVQSHWQGAEQGGDDWPGGVPALLDTWVLTQPQSGAMKTRADDQTAFLIDQQSAFYADMAKFIRTDLGYKGLVNACNWITADPVRLNDAERFTYRSTDVFAVNRYYEGGVHIGPNAGWRIDQGDFFSDRSALLDPRSLPFNIKQTAGHPMVITESAWVSPLGYQAEGPLLAAAYESLTRMQGLYWFELAAADYDADSTIGFVANSDGSHPTSKWTQSVPQTLGQFPAAALLYRLGYVKAGPTVVHEARSRKSLDSREVPLIAEDPTFDPNHFGGDSRAGNTQATGIDPLAFLVGRVEDKFIEENLPAGSTSTDGDPNVTTFRNVAPYINRETKTVTSITHELSLDYGNGIFELKTPKAQAVAGFLSKLGGVINLGDVTIQCSDPYATITVVAMDDKPIASSAKLLVQVGSVVRPTGWKQERATHASQDGKSSLDGWQVTSPGRMPWQVHNVQATLTVANPNLRRATSLDAAGYPMGSLPVRTTGGKIQFSLPAGSMYVVLE